MDLQLDTEHTILADSAERFLSENYDHSARHGDTGDGGGGLDRSDGFDASDAGDGLAGCNKVPAKRLHSVIYHLSLYLFA